MADIFIHISEMLAWNGRMYPDEKALVERDPKGKRRVEITWKEFDRKADRMANFLTNLSPEFPNPQLRQNKKGQG